jgi:HSP90 family molecular chaperone
MNNPEAEVESRKIPFRAETSQVLEILIHSLYSEREVFLRELISNASDALTRMDFELLTNRQVLDPEQELAIWVTTDPEENTLTITDSGIGMTEEELIENLGTIAHSGARDFLKVAQEKKGNLSDIIGQFGVGFYSAFMVADTIQVTSRSYLPEAQAAVWSSTGADTFEVKPAEKNERGTTITLKLKEDARELVEKAHLRQIIKKHSDYIPFPIYLGDEKEQVNEQTALWRQQPRQVEEQKYIDFYKEFTLDGSAPLTQAHMAVDAPVQMYALLFVPGSPERNIFSLRKQEGIKLYARKVLIQEYSTDLLPEYLLFVDGVVDSEDLPLNVSREMVQSSRTIATIKKLIVNKLIETLKNLGEQKAEAYETFWKNFGRNIKQGIATDAEYHEALLPLLRFKSLAQPDKMISLKEYCEKMPAEQKKIYYILGEDSRSAARSPHLDQFRHTDTDVLLMTDPMDSFMLLRMTKYKDFEFANAANEKLEKKADASPESGSSKEGDLSTQDTEKLIALFKQELSEQVSDVKTTDVLIESPARLVNADGAPTQEVQRVYKLLNREFEAPKKELKINPHHPILKRLGALPDDSPLAGLIIEQIYEDALLIEGLHPDPAGMIERIQKLMEAVLKE